MARTHYGFYTLHRGRDRDRDRETMGFCIMHLLYTPHRDRDRDREWGRGLMGPIPIFPVLVPVPVPCSVYKPLDMKSAWLFTRKCLVTLHGTGTGTCTGTK